MNDCPACGGKAEMHRLNAEDYFMHRKHAFFMVECVKLKCQLGGPNRSNALIAARDWNRLRYERPVK